MVFYMLTYLRMSLPEYFITPDPRQKTFIILSFLALSVMFPLFGIALMKMQGLVNSFDLKTKKERIGPLILIAVFYLWLYVNIRQNTLIPDMMSSFVLGSVIAVFLGLFLNSFSKISLHCIGVGGLTTSMFFLYSIYPFSTIDIVLPLLDTGFSISNELILFSVLLLAGLIGTVRLLTKAHHNEEIYGGYLVGICSQLVALQIYY
ncbi:MAG: hypothetical protein IPL63_08090 [Saprospiraceae bacterium]|nr:hypothetical protein [Saprospiraceae bacterium]MBK8079014.1 hypothetical protein [Saprospiraceae bacterium]MBK8547340.1 hypothetical protein [Saprospiraceae bacterium]